MDFHRPIEFERHPLVEQKYIVPTPSIEELYEKVKRLVRLRTPGAIIYAHPRFGKTYSIRYVIRVLRSDMPGVVTELWLPKEEKPLGRRIFQQSAQSGRASCG